VSYPANLVFTQPKLPNGKKQAIEAVNGMFIGSREKQVQSQDELIKSLYEQVGKLQVESDWLKKKDWAY